jgi:UDP-glucose 4-epimerase
MRGEPISVYGDGQQIRAFTYVKDIVGTFLAAADRPDAWGKSFNVGGTETSTVLNLASQVRTAMGAPEHQILHLPTREEVRAAYTDTSLARRILGDWTDTPLAEGLCRTAQWAQGHGPVAPTSTLNLESADAARAGWLSWAAGRVSAT